MSIYCRRTREIERLAIEYSIHWHSTTNFLLRPSLHHVLAHRTRKLGFVNLSYRTELLQKSTRIFVEFALLKHLKIFLVDLLPHFHGILRPQNFRSCAIVQCGLFVSIRLEMP